MILYNIFKLQKDKYASANYFSSNDLELIKKRLKEFDNDSNRKDFLSVFPMELRGIASRAISPHESSRPDLNELKTNPWFQDNLVKGIYYLDNFYNLPETNKNLFLASLVKIVPSYSQEVIEKRIVPFISANMIHHNLTYNLTLLTLVIVDKKLINPAEKRKEEIWPIFLNLLKSKKISGQLLYLLVSYIDIVCDLLNDQEIQNHIVALLFKCFDCKVPQIQLVSIEKTYALCQKVSFGEMKAKILPRMLMLCSDPDLRVKKRALTFIKERLDLLDPSLVQSQALSIIEGNLTQNNPPHLNFLLLDLLEEIAKHYEVELIANKILPILISFLVNKSSSKSEFERYHDSIITFLTRIKEKRLMELNSQPFKAKAEEPEDPPLVIQSLEQLVASTRVEGFDSLFSKQNQLNPTSSPNHSQHTLTMSNDMFQAFPDFPTASTPTSMAGTTSAHSNSGMNMTFGTTPPAHATASAFPAFNTTTSTMPKAPEKSFTPTPAMQATIKPSSGGISASMMDDLGFGTLGSGATVKKPMNTPAPKSNYDAFDLVGKNSMGQSGGNDLIGKPLGGLMASSSDDPFAGIAQSSSHNPNFAMTLGGNNPLNLMGQSNGLGGMGGIGTSTTYSMDLGSMGGLGGANTTFGMGNTLGANSGMINHTFGGGGMGGLSLGGSSTGMGGMGSLRGMGGLGGSSGVGSIGGGFGSSGTMGGFSDLTFGGNQNLLGTTKPQTGVQNTNTAAKGNQQKSNAFNEFDLL